MLPLHPDQLESTHFDGFTGEVFESLVWSHCWCSRGRVEWVGILWFCSTEEYWCRGGKDYCIIQRWVLVEEATYLLLQRVFWRIFYVFWWLVCWLVDISMQRHAFATDFPLQCDNCKWEIKRRNHGQCIGFRIYFSLCHILYSPIQILVILVILVRKFDLITRLRNTKSVPFRNATVVHPTAVAIFMDTNPMAMPFTSNITGRISQHI